MGKKKSIENDEIMQNEVIVSKKEEKNTAKDTVEDDKMKIKKSQTPDNKIKKLKEELKLKDKQTKELQDKYLRLSAEFDNYRKRTLKEKIDMIKYASEEVLKDLLPVIDDFERAYNNINEVTDIKAIKEGMDLINNKFKNFVNQKGLKEIEALNQDFNMDLHEAITKIPAPDEKLKGKIVDVIEKGYYLNDKVIRFAKVVIGE